MVAAVHQVSVCFCEGGLNNPCVTTVQLKHQVSGTEFLCLAPLYFRDESWMKYLDLLWCYFLTSTFTYSVFHWIFRGAHIDVRNKKGNTPLWLAANGGHYDVVQLLVQAGADVDAADNRKITPLMSAFRKVGKQLNCMCQWEMFANYSLLFCLKSECLGLEESNITQQNYYSDKMPSSEYVTQVSFLRGENLCSINNIKFYVQLCTVQKLLLFEISLPWYWDSLF